MSTVPNSTDSSVVGGTMANIEDFPYQAAILDNFDEQVCGGVIIARDAVITAQHCVDSVFEPVYVGAGKSNWPDLIPSSILVRYTIHYPRFNDATAGKDIAVLILQQQLTYSTKIQPIAMATPADSAAGYTDAGVTAYVSGWGSISRGVKGVYPEQLRSAEVKIVSREFAAERIKPLSYDQLPAGQFPGAGRSESLFYIHAMYTLELT
jgi:secreted trypsin-like serine protease